MSNNICLNIITKAKAMCVVGLFAYWGLGYIITAMTNFIIAIAGENTTSLLVQKKLVLFF